MIIPLRDICFIIVLEKKNYFNELWRNNEKSKCHLIEAISRHVARIFVHTYTYTHVDRINMYDKNVNIILVAGGERVHYYYNYTITDGNDY